MTRKRQILWRTSCGLNIQAKKVHCFQFRHVNQFVAVMGLQDTHIIYSENHLGFSSRFDVEGSPLVSLIICLNYVYSVLINE